MSNADLNRQHEAAAEQPYAAANGQPTTSDIPETPGAANVEEHLQAPTPYDFEQSATRQELPGSQHAYYAPQQRSSVATDSGETPVVPGTHSGTGPVGSVYPANDATHAYTYPASGNVMQTPQAGASTDKLPGQPSRGKRLRVGALIALAIVIALVFGGGIAAGWEYGQQTAAPITSSTTQLQTVKTINSDGSTETQQEQVIAKTRPGIVQITVQTSQGTSLGSGVIINKNGYIVTNNHVVAGSNTATVQLADGTTINNATVIAHDSVDDLAVLKIPASSKLTVVAIGDSSKLSVGQTVLAIGNPLGNTQTVTHGIISALNRTVTEGSGAAAIPNAIQTDAAINPGNSGGALINEQGQLIGIPTLAAVDPETNTPASGVGFAISSNSVNNIVSQVINNGKITHTGRAGLGVSIADVTQQVQAQYNLAVDHGVLLTNVTSGKAAAKAGLQAGDVIVQVDNTAVNSASALQQYTLTKQPGQQVTIKAYDTNGQLKTYNATLDELLP